MLLVFQVFLFIRIILFSRTPLKNERDTLLFISPEFLRSPNRSPSVTKRLLGDYRFAGRVLEFLVGLFLLCNSAFILIYENGGAIRAVLVGLHAYFNLWCEARVGWKIFTRRRTAVHKIATLETVDQPDTLDDVCAICFHDLKPSGQNNASRIFLYT